MTFQQPAVSTLRAVVTTFAAIAILGTAARLYHRYAIRKLWWDDAWAMCSLMTQFSLLIGLWIRTDTPDVGPLHQSHAVRIVAYWIVTLSFTCTLWAARMSMLFSIIRITPTLLKAARYMHWLVVFFLAMWAALVMQKTILCATDKKWYHDSKPQCRLGHRVGILELSTDFVSDFILLFVPVKLISSVSTPFAQKRLLIAVFSASILTTLTSVVHAYYLLEVAGLVEGLTANVEASVALIVANLAVIATWIYNRLAPTDENSNIHIATWGGTGGSSQPSKKSSKKSKKTGLRAGLGAMSTIRFASDRAPQESQIVLETVRPDPDVEEGYGDGRKDLQRSNTANTMDDIESLTQHSRALGLERDRDEKMVRSLPTAM